MLIRCTFKGCDFGEEGGRNSRMKNLYLMKLEHEYLNLNHKVAFVFAIRAKLVEKTDPETIYTSSCKTCWENYGSITMYETISRLDLDRFIENHSKNMAAKDKKKTGIIDIHEFRINHFAASKYVLDLQKRSPTIRAMIDNDITVTDLSKATDIIRGNDEMAFFMKDPNARVQETLMGINLWNSFCPMSCKLYEDVNECHNNPDFFEEIFLHTMKFHGSHATELVQQFVIFTRNKKGLREVSMEKRKRRHDRMSVALRNLNKMGVAMGILASILKLQNTKIGDYTYDGMVILGRPEWVQHVEAEEIKP